MKSLPSDLQLEEMIKSAVNSSGPLPPDEKFSLLISALRELQERRKAAMDSEPVAWTDEAELRDVDRGGCGYLFTVNPVTPHADERRIILLYRHAQQPAAVVLEEMTADGIIDMHECGYVEGWNACRAAMLQAGNSPVIPDCWIPVSERMPDDEQEVIVQTHSGWRYVSFYDAHSRLFFDSPDGDIEHILVTHWMPLPADPQEVKP